jgi:hypothetical protein
MESKIADARCVDHASQTGIARGEDDRTDALDADLETGGRRSAA